MIMFEKWLRFYPVEGFFKSFVFRYIKHTKSFDVINLNVRPIHLWSHMTLNPFSIFTIWIEKINDVLCYLNKLDFTDNINDTVFGKLKRVKRILLKKFEDYNISKLIDVFSFVDNLFITLTVGELQDIFNKTDALRENSLYLINFKHFVERNVEPDWSLSFEFGHMLFVIISHTIET